MGIRYNRIHGGGKRTCYSVFGLLCFNAAAAKLVQSCPTLCDPKDGSPPGSSVPGILQARTLEWVAISFSNSEIPKGWDGGGVEGGPRGRVCARVCAHVRVCTFYSEYQFCIEKNTYFVSAITQ